MIVGALFGTLKVDIDKHDAQINNYENEIKDYENKIKNYENKIKDYVNKISEYENKIENQNIELDNFKKELLSGAGILIPNTVTIKTSNDKTVLGSGFIIDKAGWVVTNNHIIGDEDYVQVDCSWGAKVVGRVMARFAGSTHTDLAFIKINPVKNKYVALLGNSDRVKNEDIVITNKSKPTIGIVTSVEGEATSYLGNMAYSMNGLMTSIYTNSLNSGEPLVNLKGEVIGIVTKESGKKANSKNPIFALSINEIKDFFKSIKNKTINEDISIVNSKPNIRVYVTNTPLTMEKMGYFMMDKSAKGKGIDYILGIKDTYTGKYIAEIYLDNKEAGKKYYIYLPSDRYTVYSNKGTKNDLKDPKTGKWKFSEKRIVKYKDAENFVFRLDDYVTDITVTPEKTSGKAPVIVRYVDYGDGKEKLVLDANNNSPQ